MKKTWMIHFTACVFLLIFSQQALPQDYPKHEFFGGFTYTGMGTRNWVGWKTSVVRNFNHYLGIAVDYTGIHASKSEFLLFEAYNTEARRYFILAGPRFADRTVGNWVLYAHFLFGAQGTSISYSYDQYGQQRTDVFERNSFAMAAGGGINYRIKGPIALRLAHVDFISCRFNEGWEKGVMLSFGLIVYQGTGSD
jgi:hypothetical protein